MEIPLLLIGAFWSSLAFAYAWARGGLTPFTPSFQIKVLGSEVIKAFLVFILAQVVVVPALATAIVYLLKGETLVFQQLTLQEKGWLNACIILGGFLGVLRVYMDLPSDKRRLLWKQTSLSGIQQIRAGILAWAFVYPVILFFSQIVSLIVTRFIHEPSIDQVAVQHVKNVMAHPFLFGVTLIEIVFLVPFMEEFLFRGLLQNWLKTKFNNATVSVLLTSLLFALFHFSSTQKFTNIELLSSLFLLSCFLGYLYERQKSLWASFALHGFFNLVSLLFIIGAK
ncbi:MAG: CPBP family intramembrane metalloprotease [Parachlamydia sp.]|jgi:hypothetical protein|nr:CPBP family intramembrane metalloprotease [Parachlamydia sp.]